MERSKLKRLNLLAQLLLIDFPIYVNTIASHFRLINAALSFWKPSKQVVANVVRYSMIDAILAAVGVG